MRLRKKEKELLQNAFAVPAPEKKRVFLRKLPRQEVGIEQLVLSQAAYIRKWVWVVSLLLFVGMVGLADGINLDVIWMLSSVMPFAALLVIVELARSSAYGMAELEMSTRFSLRTILLARMVLLGAVQLFGLLLTIPVAGMDIWQNGVYLLVPYLLTAVLSLMVVRRLHGKEGLYACGSISVFVSVLCPMSGRFVPALYEEQNVVLWAAAAVLLVAGLVKEYRETMNRWEEILWN